MLTRSAAFDAAAIAGAPTVVTATVARGGVQIASLNLLSGATVTLDEATAARRTFSGQVVDTGGLAPHVGSDPLAPFGIELTVQCGFQYPNGTTETVPAGVFRVDVTQATSTGLITMSGPDRSAVVANHRNETPFTIAGGTPLDYAIGQYLNAAYPGLPFSFDGSAHAQTLPPTPTVYGEGSSSGDPWKNCQDLATSFGRELFIDATGGAILRPVPDPATLSPVWTYAPGPSNLALSGTHVMDTSPNATVYNVAIVEGIDATGAVIIRSSKEVTDPSSPVYPATFGRRPTWLSSTLITTQAQADAAATALLLRKMGASDNTAFSAVPHPAHEPGDVVSYSSTLLGIPAGNIVLSAWQLRLDLMQPVSYRTRTTT